MPIDPSQTSGLLPTPSAVTADDVGELLKSQLQAQIAWLTRHEATPFKLEGIELGESEGRLVQRVDVDFSATHTSGIGRGSAGYRREIHEGVDIHAIDDLRGLFNRLPGALAKWDRASADELLPRLLKSNIDAGATPAYHNFRCRTCGASGRCTCPTCNGGMQVRCGACYGGGRVDCSMCQGRGNRPVTCYSCGGSGQKTEYVMDSVWDSQANQFRTVSRTVYGPCTVCYGMPKSETCNGCSGCGKTNCGYCFGSGMINCSQCAAQGTVPCAPCGGTGFTHEAYDPSISINHSSEVAGLLNEPLHERIWNAARAELAGFVSAHSPGESEIDSQGIRLQRHVRVPFAQAVFAVNDDRRDLLAIGPEYRLTGFAGIGDTLLDNDLAALEACRHANAMMERKAALAGILASRIHHEGLLARRRAVRTGSVAIRDAATKDAAEAYSKSTGNFVGTDHIARLYRATDDVTTMETDAIHGRGLRVAVAMAGIVAIASVAAAHWYLPPVPAWLLISMGVVGIGLWFDVKLRFGSALAVKVDGKRASGLLLDGNRALRNRYASYVALAIAAGALSAVLISWLHPPT